MKLKSQKPERKMGKTEKCSLGFLRNWISFFLIVSFRMGRNIRYIQKCPEKWRFPVWAAL